MPNPHTVLQTVHDLLESRGFVLVAIPNDTSLLRYVASLLYRLSFGTVKKGVESLYFPEHVTYFTNRTLCDLMARNGFRLRELFYTSTDLAKYTLRGLDGIAAGTLVTLGRWLNMENRMVGVFQRCT